MKYLILPSPHVVVENVKIFRGGELITGDYAKINTVDESYYVTSDDTKKVKVLLKRTDE